MARYKLFFAGGLSQLPPLKAIQRAISVYFTLTYKRGLDKKLIDRLILLLFPQCQVKQ